MKALPTTYNGIRYRSRTEARWAVFFDLVGIHARYEEEGYQTSSGPYLPDFVIRFGEKDAFFEVKGQDPTERERALAVALARDANAHVFIACGAPAADFVLIDVFPDGQIGGSEFPREWRRDLEQAGGHQFPIFDDGPPPYNPMRPRFIQDRRDWRAQARSSERSRRGPSPKEIAEREWERIRPRHPPEAYGRPK